jgi:hypothetical protein
MEYNPFLKLFTYIVNPGDVEPVPAAPLTYFDCGDTYLPPVSSAASSVSIYRPHWV